jgi:glutathione S-transferase
MASDLILWGVGTSRTMRAHWAMHELSLSYECRPIRPRSGETEKPEFTQLNARKKIPLLQDGDFTIGESAAIVAYLSRAYSTPDCSLIPGGDRDFAKWLEWCFFIMTELDSTSLYVMRRHRELGHIYGHAPEVVEQAAEYFRKQLQHVQMSLRDQRQYLMGDQFTSADILLTTCLVWAIDYKVGVTEDTLPYLRRTTSRPAYQKGVAANGSKGPNLQMGDGAHHEKTSLVPR